MSAGPGALVPLAGSELFPVFELRRLDVSNEMRRRFEDNEEKAVPMPRQSF